ncbi:hypothetical protein BDZ97DRAFT_1921237 [Flammula alnicola]|nr:hypothetical protein BDZ97DRAFT_1921237 [Flammula alnicola]
MGTAIHDFGQGNGPYGEVSTDFAIPTLDFARPSHHHTTSTSSSAHPSPHPSHSTSIYAYAQDAYAQDDHARNGRNAEYNPSLIPARLTILAPPFLPPQPVSTTPIQELMSSRIEFKNRFDGRFQQPLLTRFYHPNSRIDVDFNSEPLATTPAHQFLPRSIALIAQRALRKLSYVRFDAKFSEFKIQNIVGKHSWQLWLTATDSSAATNLSAPLSFPPLSFNHRYHHLSYRRRSPPAVPSLPIVQPPLPSPPAVPSLPIVQPPLPSPPAVPSLPIVQPPLPSFNLWLEHRDERGRFA